MQSQDYTEECVCYKCIGDTFLSDQVKRDGDTSNCTFCGNKSQTLTVNSFATRIEEVIEQHFRRSSSQPEYWDSMLLREGLLDFWTPHGDQIDQLIAEMSLVDQRIATNVTECLASRYSYEAGKYGVENPYGDDAYYQERAPNFLALSYSWQEFCNEIKYRDRFFPANTELVLDGIFGHLEGLQTVDGTLVIREVSPGDETFQIWRARTAETFAELAAILGAPVQQLGSPPSKKAEAGRMNPKGISVFYGALDKQTCIAEVRPPVGSQVVCGKFDLIRPLRLLDLGALSKSYIKASFFDPDYASTKGRAAFIRHLAEEISKPITPREVEREYLPTQFVASYLARKSKPPLDGIIFPSSQVEGEGQNLVLFNQTRGVQQYDLPEHSEVRVYPPDTGDDGQYMLICEIVPSEPETDELEPGDPPSKPNTMENPFEAQVSNEVFVCTLSLDVETIECTEIKNVKYITEDLSIYRHRETFGERDTFNSHIEDYEPESDLDDLEY